MKKPASLNAAPVFNFIALDQKVGVSQDHQLTFS